jgi:hypothetical protein
MSTELSQATQTSTPSEDSAVGFAMGAPPFRSRVTFTTAPVEAPISVRASPAS